MKRQKPSTVHRIVEHGQVVLAGRDTVLLVLRGSCTVRNAAREERVSAGTVLVSGEATKRSDARVSRALALLQAEPAKRWTVERLARAVGMSRAAFARRFGALTGQPPLRYLAELRLALAATSLEGSDEALSELAARVGYSSEFAFSRAFKRRYGVAPGTFRRLLRGAPSTVCLLAAA